MDYDVIITTENTNGTTGVNVSTRIEGVDSKDEASILAFKKFETDKANGYNPGLVYTGVKNVYESIDPLLVVKAKIEEKVQEKGLNHPNILICTIK